MYKDVDIAWAAGLIEGEGCFTLHSNKHPYFLLDTTDKDVVEKFHKIFPFTNLRGPYTNSKKLHYKDRWRVDAFGSKARHIMITVSPYLCSRRLAKINELLEY